MNDTKLKELEDEILLLASAVDKLFSELLQFESVTDMDPELLETVQHAAEVASEHYVEIDMPGGDGDE